MKGLFRAPPGVTYLYAADKPLRVFLSTFIFLSVISTTTFTRPNHALHTHTLLFHGSGLAIKVSAMYIHKCAAMFQIIVALEP